MRLTSQRSYAGIKFVVMNNKRATLLLTAFLSSAGANAEMLGVHCPKGCPTVSPANDPVQYVLSLNLHRRHLNESQRAMVAANIASLGKGRPENNRTNSSIKESVEKLNVGTTSVKAAKAVQREGSDELVEAVQEGKVSVSAAADVAAWLREERRPKLS